MTEQEWLTSNSLYLMTECLLHQKAESGVQFWCPAGRVRKLQLLTCACSRLCDLGASAGEHEEAVGLLEMLADTKLSPVAFLNEVRGRRLANWTVASCDRSPAEVLDLLLTDPSYQGGTESAACNLFREVVGDPFRPLHREPTEVTPEPREDVGTYLMRRKTFHMIRDIVGPYHVTQAMLTPTVLALARNAYEARDWAALPVLADALEDAGCTEPRVLRHLRGEEYIADAQGLWRVCEECGAPFLWPLSSGRGGVRCPRCRSDRYYKARDFIPMRGPHVRGCHVLDLILGKE